jgi:hypothetical protein
MTKGSRNRIQFWGGPMDGSTIPAIMSVMDYMEITIVHNDVDKVCYLYEYREDTNDFEYVGQEQLEEDDV